MNPLRSVEVDPVALPHGPVDLVVAAGIHEQRGARVKRLAGILRRRRDGPEFPQRAEPWHRQHEVVRQLVEGALDPEIRVEREREDDRVGRHVAPGVIADQQDRPFVGDVAQPAHLAAVPEARQQPHQRQPLADEVRIAFVEVGAGDPLLGLSAELRQCARQQRST